MKSAELGFGRVGAPSRWIARAGVPRVLILAITALLLTNIPSTRYGGQPNYVWSSLAVLLVLWQVWRHSRLAWAIVTVATAVTLARILDTVELVGLWPTTSRQITSILCALHNDRKPKSKGRLGAVQRLSAVR